MDSKLKPLLIQLIHVSMDFIIQNSISKPQPRPNTTKKKRVENHKQKQKQNKKINQI